MASPSRELRMPKKVMSGFLSRKTTVWGSVALTSPTSRFTAPQKVHTASLAW